MSLIYLKQPIKGIIQVGANTGQEYGLFVSWTMNLLMFEPHKETFDELVRNCPVAKCENLALGDREGTATMYVADNGSVSSSLLEPHKHLEISEVTFSTTSEVPITTLDSYIMANGLFGKYDALFIDVQGYELNVLRGAVETLKTMRQVQTEVSNIELYKGNAKRTEVDEFMFNQGFRKITFYPADDYVGGETLYER